METSTKYVVQEFHPDIYTHWADYLFTDSLEAAKNRMAEEASYCGVVGYQYRIVERTITEEVL